MCNVSLPVQHQRHSTRDDAQARSRKRVIGGRLSRQERRGQPVAADNSLPYVLLLLSKFHFSFYPPCHICGEFVPPVGRHGEAISASLVCPKEIAAEPAGEAPKLGTF